MQIHTKFSGHVVMRHAKLDGSADVYAFDNTILNQGLDRLAGTAGTSAASQTVVDRVFLGNATGAPAVTDTSIGGTASAVATGNSPVYANTNVSAGSPTWTYTVFIGRQFTAGAATGTWSRVGVGWGSTLGGGVHTDVFAMTQIKDAGGNPTSITILAGETLDVRYELRIQVDASVQGPYSVPVNGVGQNVTSQVHNLNKTAFTESRNLTASLSLSAFAGSAYLYAANGSPALVADPGAQTDGLTGVTMFTSNSSTGYLADTYVAGNYRRDITIEWPAVTTHASNTVRGVKVSAVGPFPSVAFLFATGVTKTASEKLRLTVRYTWARA